jgi:hypothetical protein
MKKIIIAIAIVAGAMVVALLIPGKTTTIIIPEKKVELTKELKPICACESAGSKTKEPTQYDTDGSVLRGKINKNDIGMCQINLIFHDKKAKEMGLDLFKEQDNIKYANWLFEKEGSTPWNWSKNCWQ